MADNSIEQAPGLDVAPAEAEPAVAAVPAPVEHGDGATAVATEAPPADVPPAAGAGDVDPPADTGSAEAAAARAAALAAQYTAQHSAAAEPNNNGNGNNKRPFEGEGAEEPAAKRLNEESVSGAFPGAGGQLTEVIHVPTSLIGKLIGKAGTTIKEIQMRGRCHLKVDHDSKELNVPVTIIGTPEDVAATKKLIDETLDPNTGAAPSSSAAPGQQGESVRKITCPVHIVGRIIGRGGETIRSLQTASGAHIMINQNFPDGQPREIEITGSPDSSERAFSMIMEIINSDGAAQPQQLISKFGAGKTVEMSCPKHMVGRVIGRGGETVKGLQRQYGAAIQIDQNANPCRVTITGPPPAVMAAERAIIDLIEDRVPGGPHGGPHGGPGGYGGFPPPYGGGGSGFPGMPPYMGFPGMPPHPYGAYGGGYGGYPAAYPQAAYGGYGGGYGGGGGEDPYAGAYAAAGAYAQQQQQQQQQPAAAAATSAASAGAAAGKVWTEIKDDQGRTYYYNTQTGVSQWEKPADA